jgi:hypothetical protein
MNISTPPRMIEASIFTTLGKSILRKKVKVKTPDMQARIELTKCAFIGFLFTARQINQPINAREPITATAITAYQPFSSKYFPKRANMAVVRARQANLPGSDRNLIYSAAR